LVYAAFGFSYIIYLTFFVKRLVADAGCSPGEAGRLFMAMGWCSLVCGVLWGGLSDRIGRRWALVGLYLTHAVSFGLFGGSRGGAGATVSAALFGLSAWSVPAIMAAASGDVMGPRLAPAALGFITLFFGLGQALGPLVAGALADRTGSLSMPLLLSAAVALAGAAGAATLRDAAPARRR
jgi:predicted MFS family arabinose efflux permease